VAYFTTVYGIFCGILYSQHSSTCILKLILHNLDLLENVHMFVNFQF